MKKWLIKSEEDILKTEIGWCEPWVFEFDSNGSVLNMDIRNIISTAKPKLPNREKKSLIKISARLRAFKSLSAYTI